MEIDRKELKRRARERMALTDPKFWIVALAYLALTTGVSWLFSFLPIHHTQATLTFFQLLLMLYTTVVQFGLCLWALWAYRQLDPGVNSLMQGFSVAGRVLLMELGIFVRIMLWYLPIALVLSIPVIFMLLNSVQAGVGMTALFLYLAALVATLIVLSLRYALSPYLLADRPDDGPSVPIYRSASLMRGWKMELFKLELSFIGWELINLLLSAGVTLFFLYRSGLLTPEALVTLNVVWLQACMEVIYSPQVVILSTLVTVPLSLWLLPYRHTARAGFYDARLVAASHEERPMPEMPPL
ncbi:MAG: DUF975 family protein [Lawsonibacter sp.]|nr:DUF975 family protein [Lawsonibacter sp.]